jgi:hypothetical protein
MTIKELETSCNDALEVLNDFLLSDKIGIILLLMFITTCAFAQFESTLSLLSKSFNVAERGNFLLFSYIGFILALSQGVLIRPLLPKVGEFWMGVAGIILMTVGLGGIGLISQYRSISLLYAILPLAVMGFSCLNPSLQSLLSRSSSEDVQGGILGLGQSFSALARIIGPIVGLSLFSDEKPWIPYLFAGMLMLSALLFFPFIRSAGKMPHEQN